MTSRPNIVVGIDGSSRGDDALQFAAVLANAVGTGLLLVHAYGPTENRQAARAILEARRTAVEDVTVELAAYADPFPSRALARVAAARGASIVVVGPSHRAGLGLVLPGSTGQQLLQLTRRTLVVVPRAWRPNPDRTLNRIGCAYDASAQSEAALDAAAELSAIVGGDLDVMRAFWSASPSGALAIAVHADLEARAQAGLAERVRELPDEANAHADVLLNDPASALIARSRELDVLVLGSRGKGRLSAVWAGSVSNRVMREAACPVIVVPGGVRPKLTGPATVRAA